MTSAVTLLALPLTTTAMREDNAGFVAGFAGCSLRARVGAVSFVGEGESAGESGWDVMQAGVARMPHHHPLRFGPEFVLRMPKMDLDPKVCGRMGRNFGKATSGKLECACDAHDVEVRSKPEQGLDEPGFYRGSGTQQHGESDERKKP
jgi:hypothetical protein